MHSVLVLDRSEVRGLQLAQNDSCGIGWWTRLRLMTSAL
jgi:hypothetical protein